jgi:TetR/AcrR family transcriptional regulator, cholesterol catabolism regulator
VKRQNRKLRAAYGEYWGQLLSEGQRSGEIRKNVDLTILRLMLLGSMNWAVTWYRSDRMPIPELARKFCEVVLKGVGLSDDQPESSSRGRRARS